MIEGLIGWALNSRFVVILLALTLLALGTYSFLNVDVEAYPDPAPAIVEIIASTLVLQRKRLNAKSRYRWKSRSQGCRDWTRCAASRCFN